MAHPRPIRYSPIYQFYTQNSPEWCATGCNPLLLQRSRLTKRLTGSGIPRPTTCSPSRRAEHNGVKTCGLHLWISKGY
eukprot:1808199-Pyramimonas_sp.AAC.1